MKLESPNEMGHVEGMRCRQAPLRGLVGGLVLCVCFVGLAVIVWQRGFPWFAWGPCVALAALFVPLVLADAAAKFRATNWLLRLGSDALRIHLRSYRNRGLPPAATVAHLPYRDIRSARRHIETWSTPSDRSSVIVTQWKEESLELLVAPDDAREIAEALRQERGRRGGIKDTSQPVTVPARGVVRIAWRGHGNDVVPALDRVLAELRDRVHVTEPTRTDRGNCYELSDADLDALIAQLVRSGDDMAATELLIRRRNCSATEAHKRVRQQAGMP
jgi:hypothetical protein